MKVTFILIAFLIVSDSTNAFAMSKDSDTNIARSKMPFAVPKGLAAQMALGGVIGGAAVFSAPLVLSAVGFSSIGPVTGTVAAKCMAGAAITGGIKAGSTYALIQSATMTGAVITAKSVAIGSITGSGIAFMNSIRDILVAKKNEKWWHLTRSKCEISYLITVWSGCDNLWGSTYYSRSIYTVSSWRQWIFQAEKMTFIAKLAFFGEYTLVISCACLNKLSSNCTADASEISVDMSSVELPRPGFAKRCFRIADQYRILSCHSKSRIFCRSVVSYLCIWISLVK